MAVKQPEQRALGEYVLLNVHHSQDSHYDSNSCRVYICCSEAGRGQDTDASYLVQQVRTI